MSTDYRALGAAAASDDWSEAHREPLTRDTISDHLAATLDLAICADCAECDCAKDNPCLACSRCRECAAAQVALIYATAGYVEAFTALGGVVL